MPTAKSPTKAAPKIERAFWDTSAIVPLCCHQDASQEMRRIARRIKRVAARWGMTVEARSAFSRLCPVCEQKITKLTGWHNHHLFTA